MKKEVFYSETTDRQRRQKQASRSARQIVVFLAMRGNLKGVRKRWSIGETVEYLSEILGVNERTIWRDVAVARAAECEIDKITGRR